MAVLTHAQIPTAHALSPHVDHHTLTPEQRATVDSALWELGIEDGHAVTDGHPSLELRLAISARAAAAIGLALPAGEEIAECALCRQILPASRVNQCEDHVLRCTIPDPADPDGTTCLGIYLGSE
jgi:hypothetical protein